jgi:2-polyprenyl-6-methoxyphenol hydroxylase-like FAD-dependent oxidoreductase
MSNETYDVVTVGGGLGASALARSLALAGRKVLVLERETQFKDRVRGEQVASWGVAEARELGIMELLLKNCAHEMKWFDAYIGPMLINHRDTVETTPQGLPNMTFFHPRMQETLITAAAEAGAEVRRGARVTGVNPGATPQVAFEQDGRNETASCRMVVGADGRNSIVRKWAGLTEQQDPDRMQISGVLVENVSAQDDTGSIVFNPGEGEMAILFPQGQGAARAYQVTRVDREGRLSGEGDLPRFWELFRKMPNAAALVDGVRVAGPLATFNGADCYVPHPYRDGVALIGDAATSSDPTWGQGLSLTLRDARTLRDRLLADEDWDAAGHAYAADHDRYYGVTHAVEDWFTELFLGVGPEADARRGRALPRIAADGTRIPDALQAGPESMQADEATRARFFGED